MKKLFGLFLLALAFLAPSAANAVNCFWVGGTGTWDSTSITNWAPTSGGAATGCQTTNAAPAAGDAITFNASSGGGTVTADSSINNIAFLSLTAGAFTGTLAFNTNNPNMSFTSFVSFTGTGTRIIDMGSGTWTITGSSGTIWVCTTVTNLTATFSNATIAFAGASANRVFDGGAQSYGAFTVANNSTKGYVSISGANTFSSITVGSGNLLAPTNSITQTISGALTITGTSSAPSGLISTAVAGNIATVSVGSASTIDWSGISAITKAGAGSITATNSLDMGRNTGVTITPPSGGGGGGRIIGGFLLERDLKPASNDNNPAWLEKAA